MNSRLKLESLEQLGWRFGLETIQTLLAEIGHPELSLKVVHVAGSNGKGSTCAFMASFLKQSGYKTGLYTSPHLCDIRERFRINGVWISPRDFDRHCRRVLKACHRVKKKLGHLPTHFEALTAIAFSWFKEQKVDWVVLEVGLGGRLDATNVIPAPAVSLIAPIGLEHQNILGKRIGQIAREKAGILKQGCPAATIQPHPEAAKAIEEVARKKGAALWLSGRDFRFGAKARGFYWEGPGLKRRFRLANDGYQITNAALAVVGIQWLKTQGIIEKASSIQKSFSKMRWPGRLEEISGNPPIVLDGAHNPEAAYALLASLRNRYGPMHWIVLNGFLSDKNFGSFVQALKPLTYLSLVTEPPSDRKKNSFDVFAAWEREGVPSLLIKNWSKALNLAISKLSRCPSRTGLLITGSLYLVGACRKSLVGLKGLDRI